MQRPNSSIPSTLVGLAWLVAVLAFVLLTMQLPEGTAANSADVGVRSSSAQ